MASRWFPLKSSGSGSAAPAKGRQSSRFLCDMATAGCPQSISAILSLLSSLLVVVVVVLLLLVVVVVVVVVSVVVVVMIIIINPNKL